MARLVFGMEQSLDGCVDHTAFAPDPTLVLHFVHGAEGLPGSRYGRRMYELTPAGMLTAGRASRAAPSRCRRST